jgi:hypothetical protein
VEVLIDRRELLEKARERGLRLEIVEKDYVLGWLTFGFSHFPELIFKGGTALAKIYFPKIWRLSEDLDFSLVEGEMSDILKNLDGILGSVTRKSGIELNLKSSFLIPEYLQLKIQYKAPISKNWIKIDVTPDDLVEKAVERKIRMTYSDYPPFSIKVETLEEIFASKLRTIIERKKCRDYFDLWKLLETKCDRKKLHEVFLKKCSVKNVAFKGLHQLFPKNLQEILAPYWDRELGRLINPAPDIAIVLNDLKKSLKFLEKN